MGLSTWDWDVHLAVRQVAAVVQVAHAVGALVHAVAFQVGREEERADKAETAPQPPPRQSAQPRQAHPW
eukprot:2135973-Pyramimonas_sp.AAC.1